MASHTKIVPPNSSYYFDASDNYKCFPSRILRTASIWEPQVEEIYVQDPQQFIEKYKEHLDLSGQLLNLILDGENDVNNLKLNLNNYIKSL